LEQGDSFSDEKVVRFSFYRTLNSLDNLVFQTNLLIYSGSGEAPFFKDAGKSTPPFPPLKGPMI